MSALQQFQQIYQRLLHLNNNGGIIKKEQPSHDELHVTDGY